MSLPLFVPFCENGPYNSLILPHLNYGIMTWGYKCDRINKLQKKAIRIVSLSKYNAHTEPIFKRLQLLKVADILKIQELKFYYRFMHNTLPRYLQRIAFHQNSTIYMITILVDKINCI